MTCNLFLKICVLHLLAGSLALADNIDLKQKSHISSWALKQIETDKTQELLLGGRSITVAVIDTGIDGQHPDLKEALWTNPGESGLDAKGADRSRNEIDDDGNGFVDDLHGWNFVSNNNDLSDHHGHGTHIAGIIASRNSFGLGNPGVAPEAKLMILKYYDPKAAPETNVENTVKAILYAVQMKAQIINYSGGGPGSNVLEEAALRQAEANNILFVAAAGNDGMNTDLRKYYPADYGLSNIISVTALNSQKRMPAYSNFGSRTVQIAAPGDEILSTLPMGTYGEMSGTSQATAFVTGVAALLMSQSSEAQNPALIIQQIIASGDKELSLSGKIKGESSLNAKRALSMKNNDEMIFNTRLANLNELDEDLFLIPSQD